MKGFGALNTSDRNTQKLKEYSAMAAVLAAAIVATVLTAGAGGAALAGAIASVAGMASATATMTTVSTIIVGALVGSAVMIGGEFVQGKAYETFNE
jgi:hypothetical protein